MSITQGEERGKPEHRRKTSRSKDENQQQTQPTKRRRVRESNPSHIGGRPVWEVNAQPQCAIAAPRYMVAALPT